MHCRHFYYLLKKYWLSKAGCPEEHWELWFVFYSKKLFIFLIMCVICFLYFVLKKRWTLQKTFKIIYCSREKLNLIRSFPKIQLYWLKMSLQHHPFQIHSIMFWHIVPWRQVHMHNFNSFMSGWFHKVIVFSCCFHILLQALILKFLKT